MNFFTLLKDEYGIGLNSQQRQAAGHVDGPALVLAGPGSGKTTVITIRTLRLILSEGVMPERILTMTFNKAAQVEMQTRFRDLFGKEGSKARFSTFHSFCYGILHDYEKRQGNRFRLIEGSGDPHESKAAILKSIWRDMNQRQAGDDELETLINEIGLVKNRMVPEKEFESLGLQTRRFTELFRAYEEYKRARAMIDFDDMLVHAWTILNRCPDILSRYRKRYDFYQVDEGQDLSRLQWEILKLIMPCDEPNVFVVADDDQSIYGFRGAEPGQILGMKEQYPGLKLFVLENNYRSSRNIVEISSSFIKSNKKRFDKNHSTKNDYLVPPFIINASDGGGQLRYITGRIQELWERHENMSIAVLYRNNLSSVCLVDCFERMGIPYRVRQSKVHFHQHWMIQDIMAFFHFALDPYDRESFLRICYRMNRYISKAMVQEVTRDENSTVMDAIIASPGLNKFQRSKMVELKHEWKRFSKMSPGKALNYIEDEFMYFSGIRTHCEKTGQSFDQVYTMFGILKTLADGIGSIPLFLEHMERLEMILESTAIPCGENYVTLTTLHAGKGLEFDTVFMVDLVQEEIPGSRALKQLDNGSEELMEEERRLFYVGMTRARHYLYMMSPQQNHGTQVARSTFVNEVAALLNQESMEKIREGTVLYHKKYGRGIVAGISDPDTRNTVIRVDFRGKTRSLDLATCLKYGIITVDTSAK
ncbi:MAG: ATP-dependent helicase [Bacillota bacterium]|nr:ATP-dependent helicase [Bacillota bacterium]